MAHISDELYAEATLIFMQENPTKLNEAGLVRDHVQARFHDEIIRIADRLHRGRRQGNVCGS